MEKLKVHINNTQFNYIRCSQVLKNTIYFQLISGLFKSWWRERGGDC